MVIVNVFAISVVSSIVFCFNGTTTTEIYTYCTTLSLHYALPIFTFFRSDFSSFQLNTFNGTVFLVQNVNGCDSDLAGGDRDQSKFRGAPNYNGAAATTGACPADDVSQDRKSTRLNSSH